MAGGKEKTEDMFERIQNLCDTYKEKGIILKLDKFNVGRSIEFRGFSVTRKIPN